MEPCVFWPGCIDNMATTKCADKQPMRECSYSDVRHKVCDHTQHKRVIME